jgi:predicted ATPase
MVSGWNLWFMGYPDRAVERMNVATAIANAGVETMLADIHGFASYIHELRREPELMKARAEARLRLSIEWGYPTGKALSEIYLGWADAIAGDLERGIARMRQYLSEVEASGCEYIYDRSLSFIAIALSRMGRFDEALKAIDESFSFTDRTGQHYYEAELHRLKGELLLARNPSDGAPAERCFRSAVDIAREQHAKSWELRATTSLARLARQTRQARRGSRDACWHLQLVHRRLRRRGPEGRQGAARGTWSVAGSVWSGGILRFGRRPPIQYSRLEIRTAPEIAVQL